MKPPSTSIRLYQPPLRETTKAPQDRKNRSLLLELPTELRLMILRCLFGKHMCINFAIETNDHGQDRLFTQCGLRGWWNNELFSFLDPDVADLMPSWFKYHEIPVFLVCKQLKSEVETVIFNEVVLSISVSIEDIATRDPLWLSWGPCDTHPWHRGFQRCLSVDEGKQLNLVRKFRNWRLSGSLVCRGQQLARASSNNVVTIFELLLADMSTAPHIVSLSMCWAHPKRGCWPCVLEAASQFRSLEHTIMLPDDFGIEFNDFEGRFDDKNLIVYRSPAVVEQELGITGYEVLPYDGQDPYIDRYFRHYDLYPWEYPGYFESAPETIAETDNATDDAAPSSGDWSVLGSFDD